MLKLNISISRAIIKSLKKGEITPAVRQTLQKRRIFLGVTYQQLCKLFGTNWTTVRKWECGPTLRCSRKTAQKLIQYLEGKFDLMIAAISADKEKESFTVGKERQWYPPCIRQLRYIMHATTTSKQLLTKLTDRINKVINETLKELLESGKPILLPDAPRLTNMVAETQIPYDSAYRAIERHTPSVCAEEYDG